MRSPRQRANEWLARPQKTNGDALAVGVVGGLITAAVLYSGGLLLDAANLINFASSIAVWAAALAAGITLALGVWIGAQSGGRVAPKVQQLDAYKRYAEHLRDALADLRRALAGELPAFSLREFVEVGLFAPAQRLMGREGGSRGDLRFSILHPDGDDFVMARQRNLFPALGHTPEGRQQFRMPIADAFSSYAYQHRRVVASGKLSEDERFSPNPKARRPYESIVSVPLWKNGGVDGVFNVVATNPDAFNVVDRTYIALLGSLIDVARAAASSSAVQTGERTDEPTELPPEPSTE